MKTIELITNHKFYKRIIEDGNKIFEDKKFNITDIDLPDYKLNELEYYIHAVGFSLVNLMAWCKQLEYGIEFISNFNYKHTSSSLSITRSDHLRYNIENYLIRFYSLNDRILQLINSVFHLCISEDQVNFKVILNNYKVSRTKVPSKCTPIKKFIDKFSKQRHAIIHKHSYLDKGLKKIELFYSIDLDASKKKDADLKTYRSKKLKEYISEKKKNLKIRTIKSLNTLQNY